MDGCQADLGVLASVERTLPLWKDVRIHEERLAVVCDGIAPGELALPTWQEPVFVRSDPDTLAGQILLFNTINFCYWGDPKWRISYLGQTWDGSLGLLMALRRGLDAGLPLLDAQYLASLGEADLRSILRGQGELRLLGERLAILRAAGRTLAADFAGRWSSVIAAARGDAPCLVRTLVQYFPSFDDRAQLAGNELRFYKRAQLAAAMLFEAFGGQGLGALAQVDRLTVFADYKLPQVLRRLGILVYSPELAAVVDAAGLLPAGDRREVEIRAATIWAAELMRRALAARSPTITALHLDHWLWSAGQVQGPGSQPYHRTLTTFY